MKQFVTVRWNHKTKVYRMLVGECPMKFSVDKEDCETPAKIMNVLLETQIKAEVEEAVEEERTWFRKLLEEILAAPVRLALAKLEARAHPLPPGPAPKVAKQTGEEEEEEEEET
jgi:hypothetical protein